MTQTFGPERNLRDNESVYIIDSHTHVLIHPGKPSYDGRFVSRVECKCCLVAYPHGGWSSEPHKLPCKHQQRPSQNTTRPRSSSITLNAVLAVVPLLCRFAVIERQSSFHLSKHNDVRVHLERARLAALSDHRPSQQYEIISSARHPSPKFVNLGSPCHE